MARRVVNVCFLDERLRLRSLIIRSRNSNKRYICLLATVFTYYLYVLPKHSTYNKSSPHSFSGSLLYYCIRKQIWLAIMILLPTFTIFHFDRDSLVMLPSLDSAFALRFLGRCGREGQEETKSTHQEPMALR